MSDREKDEQTWQRRKSEVQSCVTPEDFALFTQLQEQMEARRVGHGLKEAGIDEEQMRELTRDVFWLGCVSGLNATERE